MNEKLQKILEQLPQRLRRRYLAYASLYRLIKDATEPPALAELSRVARSLANYDPGDPIFVLSLWAGLKNDTPDMGADYIHRVASPDDYLAELIENHQTSVNQKPPGGNHNRLETTDPSISRARQRARLITNALVEQLFRASRDQEREQIKSIWIGLFPALSTLLSDEEAAIADGFSRTIFNRTSFGSSYHTYLRWRMLNPELKDENDSTSRRRIRNIIKRQSWPNEKSARSAALLSKRLDYDDAN